LIYEFECAKGHITEEVVPMGTVTWPCHACIAEMKIMHERNPDCIGAWNPLAKRILSATKTTFVHADTNRRLKMVKQIASKRS
jgi:hypothetical protein